MGKNYHLVIKSFVVIVYTKNKLREHFDQSYVYLYQPGV